MTQTDIQNNNANKIKAQDKINIIRAKYIASAVKKAQYPEECLKEIAFILGYEDASSFIAVFKKHYGKTPANYLAK